jgi:periplasmic protein TonB
VNGNLPKIGAWHLKMAWIDKEVYRWSVCLMIVIAIHVGLIVSFAARKQADLTASASTAMMIDLGPLPGLRGHGVGSKSIKPQHAAKPLVLVETKKHQHFHPLVKLQARIQHLLKPRPKVVQYTPPPLAVSVPKRPSSTLVATAGPPAAGFDNIRIAPGTGSSVRPQDSCCSMGHGGAARSGQSGPVTWQGLLLADLESHKRYPPEARERGEQGVVYLRFAMDRRGKVLSLSLQKSSGFGDLDQETLDLIERSQPLPPPPPTITGSVIELVVPIQFELQQDD